MQRRAQRFRHGRSLRLSAMTAALLLSLTAFTPVAHAQAKLKKYTSRFYDVYTDADRAEAAIFGRHMDRVFAQYTKRFSSFKPRYPDRKLALYLFNNQKDYLAFLRAQNVNATNSAGMFVVTREVRGLFTWLRGKSKSSTLDILEHEGFHQFAMMYLGTTLPVWANEGLAQYFEDGILIRSKMHLGLINAQRLLQVQAALKDNYPLVTFDQLFNMNNRTWMATLNRDPKRSSLLYSYAWSVVYFLIHGENGRYRTAFGRYLNKVAEGAPSAKAFHEAFGLTDVKPLRKKWAQFVLQAKPDPMSVALARMEFLGSALRSMQESKVPIPKDLSSLKATLQRVGFRAFYMTHGVRIEYNANDDALFTYTAKNGNTLPFVLLEPAKTTLPPRISAPGLRPQPMLVWSHDKQGALVQDFEYK